MQHTVLGVPIDDVTLNAAAGRIHEMVLSDKPHLVFYANPETLLRSARDGNFSRIMRAGDLIFPDGIGLKLLKKIVGASFQERIAGSDLLLRVCENAARSETPVFLLGGKSGVAEKAARELQRMFPQLRVAGARDGFEGMSAWEKDMGLRSAKIALVGLGSPRQEEWIFQNVPKLTNLRVAIAVGGAFDTLSGVIPRAPRAFRKAGLEWLWRFAREPKKRWKRIINAVVLFPLAVLRAHKKTRR